MITLKKCNYFTGDINHVSNAVSKIVKFLEVDGINSILFTPPKPIGGNNASVTGLIHQLNPQIIWYDYSDFESKIKDKSNLFRVNLIVFDFWTLNRQLIVKYKELIDELNIKHIIVAKEYLYKNTDDVADFHVKTEYKDISVNSNSGYIDSRSETWLTNKIDGWKATLDSLKTEYIRDKKIDDIINSGSNDVENL